MKLDDPDLREVVRVAPHPKEEQRIGKKHRRRVRRDWKSLKKTFMTRAVYLKCRTHWEAAETLLATGTAKIVETGQ